jgi:hypothetical protein
VQVHGHGWFLKEAGKVRNTHFTVTSTAATGPTEPPVAALKIEADYVWVNFTLKHSEEIAGSNVYVGGAFNDWKCNANNKMVYDPEEGCYRARIFLKQGFYNYQYLVLKDGSKEPDPVFFEGSLSETENEYLVLVYHRHPGQPFESLVGARIINTLN